MGGRAEEGASEAGSKQGSQERRQGECGWTEVWKYGTKDDGGRTGVEGGSEIRGDEGSFIMIDRCHYTT